MKKIMLGIVALISVFVMTNVVKAENLVKVYIFEAGGCPACEAQVEYLEKLDSYNKKFEIVKKELYVDHVDWAKGKDYDLGVKVSTEFKNHGFDAGYDSTPLVVVSDIYAQNGYNAELEKTILEAYEKGDKDTVKCIEDGKSECFTETNDTLAVVIILVVIIGGMAGLVALANKKN
jgi:hypothetical protein